MDRYFFAPFLRQTEQRFLGHRQHPACTAGRVIKQISAGSDLIRNRLENQVGHQGHDIPGGEVFACFLVIFFIEPADQFLKYRAHGVIVQPRQ